MSEIGAFGKGPKYARGRPRNASPPGGAPSEKGYHVHFESENRLDPRRTGEGKAPVRIHGSRWNNSRGGIAAATVAVLLFAGSPLALGAPSDPPFPSQDQVDS